MKLIAIAAAGLLAAPAAHAVPIFGEDDRYEVHQASAEIRTLAESTAVLFPSAGVAIHAASVTLRTARYGTAARLSAGQKFSDQPVGGFCSASLVGSDILLTAGHCLDIFPCERIAVVFGFAVDPLTLKVPATRPQDVYRCAETLGKHVDQGYQTFDGDMSKATSTFRTGDWALLRLDRPVEGRRPLGLRFGWKPGPDSRVFAIGYPLSLPAKVTAPKPLRSLQYEGFLSSDQDTLRGASGSPLFESETLKIVGVVALTSGEDHVWIPQDGEFKARLNVVPEGYLVGTLSTKADLPAKTLQRVQIERAIKAVGDMVRAASKTGF